MADRPSRLTLARLVAGELPPEEASALEARIAADPESARALEELRRNVARYDERRAAHWRALHGQLDADARPPVPSRSWLWPYPALGLLAAAAAVTLVVALHRGPAGTVETVGGQVILFKGDLAVRIVARSAGAGRQLVVRDGDSLAAGDALRFVVTTGSAGFITVFSVDRSGKLSPFYPSTEPARDDRPLALPHAGQHELPASIVLDDAPGPEHLIVVFAPRAFSRRAVHGRIGDQVARGELGALRAGRRSETGETLFVCTIAKRTGPP